MQATKLLFLILAFLTAILLHLLLTRVENFEAAKRTPLTKENIQSLFDEAVLDLLAYYQKLEKAGKSTTDNRIKYRLVDLANAINALNYQYPAIQNTVQTMDFKPFAMITLEDLKLVKDFFTRRVGITAEATISEPVNMADLDMLSNRSRSLFGMIQQKMMGVPNSVAIFGQLSPAGVVIEFGNSLRQVLENIKKLKQGLPNMKKNDIPLLRADLYMVAFIYASTNFTMDMKLVDQPVPQLEVNNLPGAKSTTSAVLSALSGTPTTPTSTTGATGATTGASTSSTPGVAPKSTESTPSGMKFSELIQTLMTYGPVQMGNGADLVKPLSQAPLTETNTKTIAPSTTKYADSKASVDDIKKTIREEIQSLFGNVKTGPKDGANKVIEHRATDPIVPTVPKVSTNSLEQGSWFRNASQEGCPYAMGQQVDANAQPVPFPIDMNDYVRKDSIPCWGCNLK